MRKSASEGRASSRHSDGFGAHGSPPSESAQTQEQDERALVQRIVQGDRDAWQRFVCDYSETLRFSILNTLRRFSAAAPGELVEDLEAELHCRLCEHGFRRLAAFRGDSSLRQWLKVVAANAVIDHLRARRPSVSLETLEEAGTELPDSSASPEEVFARQELEQAVERLFEQLGDEDRLFVELHYARGLPHERVAELMGCSVGAVYARKNRIRKRLSELAQELSS